ncbi:MAG: DUF411 domain-containing protein [Acidobacteriota bacterium]
MTRKQFAQMILATVLVGIRQMHAAGPRSIKVYKTPTCGCCGSWVQHLRENGFEVDVQDVKDTSPYRHKFGIPAQLMSCHTAVVNGYAIEGHVPASDIQRLLREKPNAKGLAVPGMPAGSPGMESARTDAYSVMLVSANGGATVFQQYPRK